MNLSVESQVRNPAGPKETDLSECVKQFKGNLYLGF